jgi:hypothetical protein
MRQNPGMRIQNILIPIASVLLVMAGYRVWGWAGVALAAGGLMLWLLLHFTRLMHVLKRAADSPLGYVGSAVMLQVKLKSGMTLMHVVALTRALGEPLSPPDSQPEIFRWTDPSDSSVTCEFLQGKLVRWELRRPEAAEEGATTRPGP